MKIIRYPACGTEAKAVVFGNTVFCAGLSAQKGDTMAEQTADILAQYDSLFAEIGTAKESLIMANTFLYDMADGEGYGQVWREWLVGVGPPAGVCVQAVLPPGQKIVISLIAAIG